MKKLVCFGDSFIDSNPKSWGGERAIYKYTGNYPIAVWLANKLKLPLINYGKSGSGIQYSLITFLEHTRSKSYDPDDIFLFIVSNKNRFYQQALDIHASGAGSTSHLINSYKQESINPNLSDEEVKLYSQKILYLKENEKYIDWTCMYHNDFSIDIESLGCLGLLNTWSLTNPNKLIVMNAFGLDYDTEHYTNLFKQSNNFLPILLDGGLKKHSVNEFINKKISTVKWVDECRVNHFSPANREILIDLLVSVITNNNTDMFDTELFKTKMYNDFADIYSTFNVKGKTCI